MSSKVSEEQIFSWIHVALENEDIKNYTLDHSGSSDKSEGYTTDVSFVTATGTRKTNDDDVAIDLVIKVSKVFKALEDSEVQDVYKKELMVYNKVFPEFEKFVRQKKSKNIFISRPKCYATLTSNGRHVIILKNLRREGYVEHNRLKPMNISHMELVLKHYAKFHAISFAYKDQNESEFKDLFGNYPNTLYNAVVKTAWSKIFQPKVIKTYNQVKQVDEKIAANIKNLIDEGVMNILEQKLGDIPNESVITHGDCWNSNFLFKYQVNK